MTWASIKYAAHDVQNSRWLYNLPSVFYLTRAECACGWKGRFHLSDRRSYDDAQMHVVCEQVLTGIVDDRIDRALRFFLKHEMEPIVEKLSDDVGELDVRVTQIEEARN